MRTEIEKMDYVGFYFNGIHTSQFGLKSVSRGNRYTRSILSATTDSVVDIVGGDGSYFFGANFKPNNLEFTLAFDDVTEKELRELTRWLYNNNQIGPIILDELPYIQYYVRPTGSPNIKFLVFDDSSGGRVYKGELSVTFTAYDPYGYIVHKFLSEYDDTDITEWEEASELLESKQVDDVDYYDTYNEGTIPLYNPGDVPVDFVLTLTVDRGTSPTIDEVVVTLDANNNFTLSSLSMTTGNIVVIDTKKRLIKIGTIVINNVLVDGNLFQLPVDKTMSLTITGASAATIEYPYKYL